MPAFNNSMEAAIQAALGQQPRFRGTLGFTTSTGYSVFVPNDPTRFFVRLATGELVKAFHRSRVPPTPDLPVFVQRNVRGDAEIVDVDWPRANMQFGAQAAALGVGVHTHARFSGLEFPIDPRLFAHLRATWTGLEVSFAPGLYSIGGTYAWWPGTSSIDLTSHRPSSALNHRWVLILLDGGVLTVVDGTDQAAALPLTNTALVALLNSTDPDTLPLLAVRLRGGQSYLVESNLESVPLTWHRGAGGGGGPVAAEDVTYDNATSGLSAADVQAAIDELAAGSGSDVADNGSWNFVRRIDLSSPAATFLIDNLPQNYSRLKILLRLRTSASANQAASALINGSTAAVYNFERLYGFSGGVGRQGFVSQTSMPFSAVPGTSFTDTDVYSWFELTLDFYADSNSYTNVLLDGIYALSASGYMNERYAGTFNDKTPVTSIAITPGAGNLVAGCAAIVWGIGETTTTGAVISNINISNPPTETELNAEFGTATSVGDGFEVIIDDGGAGTDVWRATALNGKWWAIQLAELV